MYSILEARSMFLLNSAMVDLQLGTAGLVAALGYAVVFVGLIALMIVIMIEGKIAVSKTAEKEAPVSAPVAAPIATAVAEPVAAPVAAPVLAAAPGSAGEVKLFSVGDREAAMLMALVASKVNRPLNELRFKSIKEVK